MFKLSRHRDLYPIPKVWALQLDCLIARILLFSAA